MNTTVKVPPRERLSAERIRRRWSQLEVADQRLQTSPNWVLILDNAEAVVIVAPKDNVC